MTHQPQLETQTRTKVASSTKTAIVVMIVSALVVAGSIVLVLTKV